MLLTMDRITFWLQGLGFGLKQQATLRSLQQPSELGNALSAIVGEVATIQQRADDWYISQMQMLRRDFHEMEQVAPEIATVLRRIAEPARWGVSEFHFKLSCEFDCRRDA